MFKHSFSCHIQTLAVLSLLMGAPCSVGADAGQRHGYDDDDHDHDRARHARLRGEIRPIAEILALVAKRVPGEAIEVELDRENIAGKLLWIYELKVLTPDGHLLDVEVDAAQGRILELEVD